MATTKPWNNKQWLYDRYVAKKLTIIQIADECKTLGYKVTPMTIWNHLKAHDLLTNARTLGKRSVGGNSSKKGGFYS